MTSLTLCLFYKYGNCQYSVNCRQFHVKETCQEGSCERDQCLQRHPQKYKYYLPYKRCKFGDYCSFSHKIDDLPSDSHDMQDFGTRIDTLENRVKEKDSEIKALQEIVENVKDQNLIIKN